MEPPFFPGEIAVHTPVSLMQTTASTVLPLLSAFTGLLAPLTLAAQTTVTYANGTVSNPRITTNSNPLTGATAAGIVATENGIISGNGAFTLTGGNLANSTL